MNAAVGLGLVWLGLFFVIPAFGIARLCAERVLLAAPDQRAKGWARVHTQVILSVAIVAVFVFFGVVMAGASATAGEGARTFNAMVFQSGAFLALLGWVAPIQLTRMIEDGIRLNHATALVRLSPRPFAALALGFLVWSHGGHEWN